MPDIISCPSCRRRLMVPDEMTTREVRCPSCQTVFQVNRTGTPIAPTPAMRDQVPGEDMADPDGPRKGEVPSDPPEVAPEPRGANPSARHAGLPWLPGPANRSRTPPGA